MTVVRLAEKLAEGHRVWVAQRHRTTRSLINRVSYGGLDISDEVEPHAIVVLRSAALPRLPTLRRRHPNARLFLWLQDWIFPPPSLARRLLRPIVQLTAMRILVNAGATLVAVSRVHQENIRAFTTGHFPGRLYADSVPTRHIFNPVCVPWNQRPAQFDPDKLVFFSAPFKGLQMVLDAFAYVRERLPGMKLFVACPSYGKLEGRLLSKPGVINLGHLAHHDVIEHVRTALCYFYPADVWPETFGIVLGEANAVGTPVIAHPHGAAPEVLTDDQLCDAHDLDAIVERLKRWRTPGGRPKPGLRPEFALTAVTQEWERLLFSHGDGSQYGSLRTHPAMV